MDDPKLFFPIECNEINSEITQCAAVRSVVPGGAAGAMAPPDFGRSTDYAHLINTGTPGFSDLLTALAVAWLGVVAAA